MGKGAEARARKRDEQVHRAFFGEDVPELPVSVRALVDRARHRVATEAIPAALAAETFGGPDSGARVWKTQILAIFDDAIAALHALDAADYSGGGARG